jgi:hypothetical protein
MSVKPKLLKIMSKDSGLAENIYVTHFTGLLIKLLDANLKPRKGVYLEFHL